MYDKSKEAFNNEIDYEKIEHYVRIESQQFKEIIITLFPELTTSEIIICVLLRCNFSIKQKAEYLNISPRTVEKHRANIRKKLCISSNDSLQKYISSIKLHH